MGRLSSLSVCKKQIEKHAALGAFGFSEGSPHPVQAGGIGIAQRERWGSPRARARFARPHPTRRTVTLFDSFWHLRLAGQCAVAASTRLDLRSSQKVAHRDRAALTTGGAGGPSVAIRGHLAPYEVQGRSCSSRVPPCSSARLHIQGARWLSGGSPWLSQVPHAAALRGLAWPYKSATGSPLVASHGLSIRLAPCAYVLSRAVPSAKSHRLHRRKRGHRPGDSEKNAPRAFFVKTGPATSPARDAPTLIRRRRGVDSGQPVSTQYPTS